MYSVEISSAAWTQLGYLSAETYRRIREELDAVAAAPQVVTSQGTAASRLSVVVDDVIALYDVDTARRCVVLLEVAHRSSQEP